MHASEGARERGNAAVPLPVSCLDRSDDRGGWARGGREVRRPGCDTEAGPTGERGLSPSCWNL